MRSDKQREVLSVRRGHYRAQARDHLSAIARSGRALVAILVATSCGACSLSRGGSFAAYEDASSITGSIGSRRAEKGPSESDLAFARNAASDVLTKGSKDSSQPWENPATGARGSVTPIANAYMAEGRTCRDFLASFVNDTTEAWMQGAACQSERGQWEIHSLKPWKRA